MSADDLLNGPDVGARTDRPDSRAESGPTPLFDERFVYRVLHLSVVAAALAGVAGWLATAEIAFAFALWAGAAVDIATFRELAVRGEKAMQAGDVTSFPTIALLFRIAAKAAILVIAMLLPWDSAFWGAFLGVLIVEFALVIVAMARSLTAMRHHDHPQAGRGVRS